MLAPGLSLHLSAKARQGREGTDEADQWELNGSIAVTRTASDAAAPSARYKGRSGAKDRSFRELHASTHSSAASDAWTRAAKRRASFHCLEGRVTTPSSRVVTL
jgi:hypothetical protein